MKRIFALALALLIMLPLCFSAVAQSDAQKSADIDKDGRITLRDAAIYARYIANWDGYTKDGVISYPGAKGYITEFSTDKTIDFGGREFKFAVRTEWWSGLSNIELAGKIGTNIEGTSTANGYTNLSQQAASLIDFLQNKYNCKIKVETFSYQATKDQVNALKNDTFSGIHTYDFTVDLLRNYNAYVPCGLLSDFNNIKTVDLDADYFDKALNDEISLYGKTFYVFGAAETSSIRNLEVMLANYQNIKNATGSDVFSLVKNGQWTFDKFWEIANSMNQNQNVTSVYGYDKEFGFNLYNGIGGNYVIKNADGSVKFRTKIEDDPVFANGVYEKFASIYSTKNGSTPLFGSSAKLESGTISAFQFYTLGRTLLDGKGKTGLAILPMPKLNASASYISSPYFRRTATYAIPTTSYGIVDATDYGFRNGAEMNGFLLSAMFNKAKELDLRGACINDILASNQYKTYASNNREMLNTIISARRLNLSQYIDANNANPLTSEIFWFVENAGPDFSILSSRYSSLHQYYNVPHKSTTNYDYAMYCALDIEMDYIKNLVK